jgi:Ran GTPase-activating protein (RanGAP) involved in mRNA processing and transport
MPGLKEICESRTLSSLTVFDLRWRPTPGLTAMLISSTFWPGLEELDLLRNNLGDNDLAAMLNTPSNLRRLELADNKITTTGANLLADHPALANITTLDLSENAIGDAGITALANSPRARNLQILQISSCGFSLAGVTALAESPHLANLHELWMSSNGLDLKGVRLLAASPHLANLDAIYLRGGLTATAKKVLKERFGDRVRM